MTYNSLHRLRNVTGGDRSHFFGFHDITPWDPTSQYLIGLRTSTPERRIPDFGDVAEVVLIEESTKAARVIGLTQGWNWQQGARQRWLGNDRVVFNSLRDGRPGARIVQVESGEQHDLSTTLSDVCSQFDRGVTVNYARLHKLYAAYGYPVAVDSLPDITEDGLFLVDIHADQYELILSIHDVINTTDGTIDGASDFFTHPSFSPSGDKVCVLHRRNLASGALVTNLIVVDLVDRSWRILADDRASHFDWIDDETIVLWCRKQKAIARLKQTRLRGLSRFLYGVSRRLTGKFIRRAVYGESFRKINVRTGRSTVFGPGVLDEDGHPMVHPRDPLVWVNDTYPNVDFIQTLMLFHSGKNRRLDLVRVTTPPDIAGTGWRCDLHPRWDPTGTKVCVDSAHEGRRQLYVLDVKDEIDLLQQ